MREASTSQDSPLAYDSVSGKPLFVAPRGRTMEAFLSESASHGWPSFRDEEVVWENMRVLANGEAVSVDGTWRPSRTARAVQPGGGRALRGPRALQVRAPSRARAGTHLGHNLPDRAGNRYCINLVSVAGQPTGKTEL